MTTDPTPTEFAAALAGHAHTYGMSCPKGGCRWPLTADRTPIPDEVRHDIRAHCDECTHSEAIVAAANALADYATAPHGDLRLNPERAAAKAVLAAAPILLAAGHTAAAEDIRAKAETLDWYEGSGVWAQAIEIAQGPITENGDDRG